MDDLSSKILRTESLREIESLLEESIAGIEFIGEVDINEEAFGKIGAELRRNCRKLNWYSESVARLAHSTAKEELMNDLLKRNRAELKRQGRSLWSITVECLRPAIFCASMVFSARYSHDDSRAFWKPYAKEVWDIEYTKEFYDTCRAYFFDTARPYLTEKMGFDLYGSKDGDLVRPVYRHTIIPAYVRDDFARWFAKNLHVMSGFSKEQLSEFLRGQNADAYDVKPLRNFLDNDDTHDIALEIIEELTAATNQLMAQRDAGNIRERFSSQIQQDLWDEYVSELGNKIVVSVSAQRPARLDWVWSFEEEDWVLRLRNLIAEAHQKPHTCVWSLATAEKALQDWDSVSQDIWPEQQTNGQWRVREISMSAADRPVINDGKFYVFDSYDNCIFEQSVPVLPNDEFQFYRITQQGMYAVPIPFKQLTPGEFLVSFRGTLQLLNAEHQVISPQQTDYYVSEIMQNNAGHQHIKRYEISLPVTIDAGTVKHRIERTKRRIAHPRLSEGHRVSNTSKRLPPVYTSNDIFIDFPEISVSTRALNVHVTGPIDDIYEPFDEHAEKEEEGYRLNLSQLIPAEQIGTYAVDVTYGFRSRLASPIEFSVLPNLRFNGPDEGVFHALNQPRIRISNVTTETVESPDESAKVKAAGNGEQLATWTDMRSSYCRLHILQHEYVVPVEWRIQRIFAWIDGTAQRDRLFPEDLDTAKIEIRGLPKSRLTLFAGAFAYTVDLNTRGAATTELRTDQLRDILNDQQSSEVSLDLLLDDEKWSFGTFMRWPETTGDKTPPKANVSLSRHARPSAPTATLIKNMIKEPPRYLDRETLFRLATTQPGMLKHHNERQLKAVWYPLARIAVAHQVQHRVQSVGWSPSHMQRSFLSRKTDSTFSLLESERRNPKFELVMISAAGYRSVHNEWKQCLNAGVFRLQSFVSLQNWASSLVTFFNEVDDSRLRMLLHEMVIEINGDTANELIRLDRHMIALAMILRSYSLTQQSTRLAILKDTDVDKDQLMNLLESANRICPSLLEWALTWSEFFIVRSSH